MTVCGFACPSKIPDRSRIALLAGYFMITGAETRRRLSIALVLHCVALCCMIHRSELVSVDTPCTYAQIVCVTAQERFSDTSDVSCYIQFRDLKKFVFHVTDHRFYVNHLPRSRFCYMQCEGSTHTLQSRISFI